MRLREKVDKLENRVFDQEGDGLPKMIIQREGKLYRGNNDPLTKDEIETFNENKEIHVLLTIEGSRLPEDGD